MNQKIRTGNFANVKKYEKSGYFPISIALSARYFNGKAYRALAPMWEFKDDEPEIYIPKYKKILSLLNTRKVLNDLLLLSGNKDIVLLCHEKEGDFCHRHIVAEWLSKEFNIEVLELGKMDNKQMELF
jgi:hypothetical protein